MSGSANYIIDFNWDREKILKVIIKCKRDCVQPIAKNYELCAYLKKINDEYNYLVSDCGNYVINPFNDYIKLSTKHFDGYHSFHLYNQKTKKMEKRYAHLCVAWAFIPKVKGKPEIDHIDRNRSNNNITNLRWADRIEQLKNRGKSK